jgi:RNA polymerase sigma-70 factor, ECF subfamily
MSAVWDIRLSAPFTPRVLALPALWKRQAARRDASLERGARPDANACPSSESADPAAAAEARIDASERAAGRNAAKEALTDEQALTRLQQKDGARDREAMDVLFARYARLILAIGYRVLRDWGEAEELVQNVFLYLYQKAGLYDAQKGSAKAWITQAAYHRALDRRDYLTYRQFYLGTDLDGAPDTLAGDFDLEREIGAKLDREQLLRAIGELPEMQHQTLKLNFFEGLNLREASERLGESLANTRHHYYRGLEKLRRSALVQSLRERHGAPANRSSFRGKEQR